MIYCLYFNIREEHSYVPYCWYHTWGSLSPCILHQSPVHKIKWFKAVCPASFYTDFPIDFWSIIRAAYRTICHCHIPCTHLLLVSQQMAGSLLFPVRIPSGSFLQLYFYLDCSAAIPTKFRFVAEYAGCFANCICHLLFSLLWVHQMAWYMASQKFKAGTFFNWWAPCKDDFPVPAADYDSLSFQYYHWRKYRLQLYCNRI